MNPAEINVESRVCIRFVLCGEGRKKTNIRELSFGEFCF
jgi:hypothetical protein